MRDFRFQVRREVDDRDSFKRTSVNDTQIRTMAFGSSQGSLLDADTATDAQKLGDERNLICRLDLDT
jgi:hypothetical protein